MNKTLYNLIIQNFIKMAKVNFLGIGVQKAGTTWLDACLKEHPEIYLHPQKELHFFDRFKDLNYIKNYESLFTSTNEKIVGEITPNYIFKPHCAELIYQYNPNIKLIAILRDPTNRAISQYKMEMSRGSIGPNSGLWDAFERNLPEGNSLKSRGLYNQQLEKYYNLFDKSQILLLNYQDISLNPQKLIQKVFEFLEVDITFIPKTLNDRVQPIKIKDINIDLNDVSKIKQFYDLSNNTNI